MLINGKVYPNDRIFRTFAGTPKPAQEYAIVHGTIPPIRGSHLTLDKPDPKDTSQLRRDRICSIQYSDDFPTADNEELQPDIPIIYLNETI